MNVIVDAHASAYNAGACVESQLTSLPLGYALLVRMTAAFSGLSDVWQARHSHLTPAS